MRGQITKGIAGFYYVKSGETVYRCKARGIFKQQDIKPATGDWVEFEIIEGNDDNLITEILPRKNCFIRPFAANVDCFVIVTSVLRPAPVPLVLDKLLVTAEHADTEAIVCVSKCDLAEDERRGAGRKAAQNLRTLREIYEPVYPVVLLSPDADEGFEQLQEMIRGKTVALAGASGVGKSTLLNRFLQGERMQTGTVSEKTERGRHTTRHVELFDLDEEGTRIFDTPGFTSFQMPQLEESSLQHLFPEIEAHLGHCRYDDCMHLEEPDCGVKQALEEGKIGESRYASYRMMLRELEEMKKY